MGFAIYRIMDNNYNGYKNGILGCIEMYDLTEEDLNDVPEGLYDQFFKK